MIDKIIKELENLKFTIINSRDGNSYRIAIDKAIEIVKKT